MLRKNESIRIDGVLGVPLPAKQHKDLGPHHLGRHLYLLGAGSVAPAPPPPTPPPAKTSLQQWRCLPALSMSGWPE